MRTSARARAGPRAVVRSTSSSSSRARQLSPDWNAQRRRRCAGARPRRADRRRELHRSLEQSAAAAGAPRDSARRAGSSSAPATASSGPVAASARCSARSSGSPARSAIAACRARRSPGPSRLGAGGEQRWAKRTTPSRTCTICASSAAASASSPGDGVHQRQGGPPHRRRHRETAARRGREAAQPGVRRAPRASPEPLAGPQVQRPRLHRPPELEREERFPPESSCTWRSTGREGTSRAGAAGGAGRRRGSAGRGRGGRVDHAAGARSRSERGRHVARGPLATSRPIGSSLRRRATKPSTAALEPIQPLHVVDGDARAAPPGPAPARRPSVASKTARWSGSSARSAMRRRPPAHGAAGRGAPPAPPGGGRGDPRARRGRSSSPPRWAARERPGCPPPGRDSTAACQSGGLADARPRPPRAAPACPWHALQEPLHALELLVPSDELGLHGLEAEPTPDAAADQGAERSARNSPLRTPLMAGRAGLYDPGLSLHTSVMAKKMLCDARSRLSPGIRRRRPARTAPSGSGPRRRPCPRGPRNAGRTGPGRAGPAARPW